MTGEFSRRSFLKYTALTAVAVAGSSLLTGCSGYAPVQHAVGTSNKVLKVVSTLEQVECTATFTTFKLVVKNGRNNALDVTRANFAVKADGYLAYQNDKLQVTSPDAEPSGQKGRDRYLLCDRKGSECTDGRSGDPYLLSRSGVQ